MVRPCQVPVPDGFGCLSASGGVSEDVSGYAPLDAPPARFPVSTPLSSEGGWTQELCPLQTAVRSLDDWSLDDWPVAGRLMGLCAEDHPHLPALA